MKSFFIVLCFFFLINASSYAQSKKELEKEKTSAMRDIEVARDLLEKTSKDRKNSLQQINLLNRSINSRQALISSMEREIILLDSEIESLQNEIMKLQGEIDRGKNEYAEIIRSIYKNHTEEEKLMYLFASESLNQFYQRIKYLKYLTDFRERKVREIEFLVVELDKRIVDLLKVKEEKEGVLEQKESESREMVKERNGKNILVKQLAQDERRLEREIREKEKIKLELESKIRKIIEEEAKKNAGRNRFEMLTPEQKLVGTAFVQNKGRLPWPVEKGVITLGFGSVDHPYVKDVKLDNPGIDITTAAGSEARAIFDGEVTNIFAILGANYNVMIVHGEYSTVYQNLVDLKVKVGDKVSTKQVLGRIHSDDGKNTAELHMQIWKGRENLDPEQWISK